ncbi:succinyldiaminopimelate transaminase [Helicobacter sp. 11S02629-2]|uniref:succinyldiaminopimelate transaminase n=1 Tax=Helicobacter sp. 11S02629-2 TaxID=1476195 RepID=UPI000BA74859|nr:succinyldiaminopimelate transaminase [Helicobacter sp. 11S02629-2]PAF42078.1 hypothetical protein BKH40_08115 [Helicobacter sp. 11S02629-2]
MRFNPYPFDLLRKLLEGCEAPKDVLNLSIGEPAFGASKKTIEALVQNASDISFYPKNEAIAELVESELAFVKHRFQIDLKKEELIPTFGSREVLFNFPQFYLASKTNPLMAFCNPFYQIYEGAALASKASIHLMDLSEKNGFTPRLDSKIASQVDLVILNSPNNPTGKTLSLEELKEWVNLALKHDFLLINDECYGSIYLDSKPASLLEASLAVGNTNFKNILVVNSLSKLASAPGLRSGFVAGDANILKEYKTYRSYVGTSIPIPLQKASSVSWREFSYHEEIREKFAKNLTLAKDIFGSVEPYTFYVWLKIQDCDEVHITNSKKVLLFNDESFTQGLYEKHGILVLPGSYLGRNAQGCDYVRIALTQEVEALKPALQTIKHYRDDFIAENPCDSIKSK